MLSRKTLHCVVYSVQIALYFVALLWWQEFATRSVAVFCLTCHRYVGGTGGGGKYRCNMHHALQVNHLPHFLPLTPDHNAHVSRHCRC